MPVYLAMLRGINVSGQKKIPMAELRTLVEDLKFKNVRTYIQSGNVVFETGATAHEKLALQLEKKISSHFKFDVPVIIRTPEEIAKILKKNPFLKEKEIDTSRLYVTFLKDSPSKELSSKLSAVSFDPDQFIITETEVFLHCPVSYGNSKLNNNFLENKLKVGATTRNWKSVNELHKMLSE
ncbi:MAG: DUF1697 domain-containing protein [Bacteroidota bacterium]|nr:DUF1697 domain-containing protein [Bacteroidota bacterium]